MSHNLIENYEALDIETVWDNNIAKPICIAITCNNKIYFKKVNIDEIDSDKIINFLLKKCSSKKIYYVHNLTFETFVFLKKIIDMKINFKIISAKSSVYALILEHGKKKIKFRCSYKLTMLSLKKLCKLAEMKQKTIFPYKILNKNLKPYMDISREMFDNDDDYNNFISINGKSIWTYKVLEEYCKNDALITKMSIIKYWEIINQYNLNIDTNVLSAAKLSVVNYFSNNSIIKKKISIKYDRILRKNYYGGRTEVFGNMYDDEILLHYDWSGMYAQCMSEKVLGGKIYESNEIVGIEKPGFYWIKFEQNLEYPILPIKRNKLLFANGIFEGWYWFEEILLAMEYGVKILSITKTIGAQYYDNFIINFVEINNNIRKVSQLHKQIGKNNNNTFYGRLGMDPEKEEEEITNDLNINKYKRIIEKNGAYVGYTHKEKSISNITVSAAITAKARIKLYRGFIEVMKNGGRLIYTDTDSIIAAFKKNEYKKKLDVQMGEVIFNSNDSETIIEDGVFAMPKTYALRYQNGKEIVKIKGFNTKPSFNEFKEKFYNKESITTENTEWNKKDFNIRIINKEKKTYLFGLDKRKWSDDLKSTTPLYL